MTWTFCTSGAAIAKAGAGANSVVKAGAYLDNWSDYADGFLCAATRKDWVASSGTISTNFKPILGEVVSDIVAMKMIAYDMGGFTSRLEAGTMLDFMRDNIDRNINILKEMKNQEKM